MANSASTATGKPVLIFDGDCGFCTSTSNFIAAKSSAPMNVHAWLLIDVGLYGLTKEQTAAKVYFVTGGKAFAGHEAFAQILLAQRNWLLKAVGFVLMHPPIAWIAKPGYSLVARYRHKLPGGTPACEMPRD